MRCKQLLLSSLVLLATSLPALAAVRSAPPPHYTENGFNPRMLASSVPTKERVKLFAHIIELANQGQVRAQDLAGTLYWKGPDIAGSPVPVNLGQARKLLANAAVHGDVLAMAKLAELELAAGRPTPAMVWAQLYARYLHPVGPLSRGYNGYASDLIGRIAKVGGKPGNAVRVGVASILNRYDQSIRDGIDVFRHQQDHGHTFLVQEPRANHFDSSKLIKTSCVAEYMMGFDAHGKPTGIWPLDAFPDPSMSKELRSYLDHVYANTVEEGSGTRYLRVSITHQSNRVRRLRVTH